jgi:hypothetical protein
MAASEGICTDVDAASSGLPQGPGGLACRWRIARRRLPGPGFDGPAQSGYSLRLGLKL